MLQLPQPTCEMKHKKHVFNRSSYLFVLLENSLIGSRVSHKTCAGLLKVVKSSEDTN